MSNFDDLKEVRITLKIASKALYFMAYSTYQEWLFKKVASADLDRLAGVALHFGIRQKKTVFRKRMNTSIVNAHQTELN